MHVFDLNSSFQQSTSPLNWWIDAVRSTRIRRQQDAPAQMKPYLLVEFCTHYPISDTINFQLEHKPGTLNFHIKSKIQIIELHTLRSGQSREK